jgi:hypothetical protein
MDESEFEAMRTSAPIFKSLTGIVHLAVLKCAVDLRLADILHSHENPITLSQLASSIDSPTPPDISVLKRIMRLLVGDQIFTASVPSDGGETLYGATKTSLWLLSDSVMSLSPIVACNTELSLLTPWLYLSQCVKEGGTAMEKVHGCKLYAFAARNPEFNRDFNNTMKSESKKLVFPIVDKLKYVLDNIRSLVDVGGGIGEVISAIVKEHPHLNGINFDLPHVIFTAPEYDGVTHIGGDMFEYIPKADTIFLKWVLHNWGDEDCIKILKNCKEAIPEKGGKVIIAENILNSDSSEEFDEFGVTSDLSMLALNGGQERTESEYKKLLEDGGFHRYKIINVTPKLSFIEAYPE